MNLFIMLFASILIGCKESEMDVDTAEELNIQSCKIGGDMCVTFYDSINIQSWCEHAYINTFYRQGTCPDNYIEVCDEQLKSYEGSIVEYTLYVKDTYEDQIDSYLTYCE